MELEGRTAVQVFLRDSVLIQIMIMRGAVCYGAIVLQYFTYESHHKLNHLT